MLETFRYTIMLMNIVRSLVIMAAILAVPGIAGAQSALQNNTTNQQQTGGAQSTGTLQDNVAAPGQNSQPGEALTQNQPESLGVVGNPNQTQPSVTVGPSGTTNQPGKSANTAPNFLPAIAIVAAILGLAVVYASYRRPVNEVTPEDTVEEPEATENIKPEEPKKKSPSGTSKTKKKKKKAHR